jgi:alpha-L-rhamnosidase
LKSILVLLILVSSVVVTQPRPQADWPAITRQSKPWTRWWWLGSIVDKQNLTTEMEKYKKAGLGGLEITPIYGVKSYEDRFINYLSPAWMDMFEHTLKEAERLDLGVDIATGNGWPFGGPWVTDEDACKNFVHKTYSLKSGERLSEPVTFIQKPLVRAVGRRVSIEEIKDPISSNANLQQLALDQVRFQKPLALQVLMAFSDTGAKQNLTAKVARDGKLDWTAPAGNWTLYAVFQGQHGKMVERAGPGGEGNVIDHFSSLALRKYLSKFEQAFAGRDTKSLRAFFNDSYEVDDAEGESAWTPNFLAEFKRRRGYDLSEQLPALFGKDSAENNGRVLCDFRETISDLLLDEFTIPWQQWAARRSTLVRNQAHGSPANILDLYAASDIPETEGQEIMRMKFASSAAHVADKRLTSAEAATWLNEHTLATLGEVKQAVDMFFLGGVNHICYHGTPFSPQTEEWPGWLFYAAVHFGPTNPFWDDFAALNRYVARCQSFLQLGKPDTDVLLYYTIHDDWSKPSRSFLNHYGGGIASPLGQVDGKALLDAGYSYDLISDRQLSKVTARAGSIQTRGGTSYRAIVLPQTSVIPLDTFTQLAALARSGATVIVRGELPQDVPGFGNLTERSRQLRKALSEIRFSKTNKTGVDSAQVGSGKFLRGSDLAQLLAAAGIKPEAMVAQGINMVRRKDETSEYYFAVNKRDQAFDGWITGLDPRVRSVAIFDPMREEKGMARLRKGQDGSTEIYLQLEPGESRILKTFPVVVNEPLLSYVKQVGTPHELAGKWSLRFFKGGPELPPPVETADLRSWTLLGGDAVKRFSGTAVYTLSFEKPKANANTWVLDLGRVAESARIKLNGKELGVLIGAPYRVRIPKDLLKDQNTLEVSVSNLMTNRIIDMDQRNVNWKKFYNTNMPARRRENAGPDGQFDASRWTPRDSGLLGPVRLIPGMEFKL